MSMGYHFCPKERHFMLEPMRKGRLDHLEFLFQAQDRLGQHLF